MSDFETLAGIHQGLFLILLVATLLPATKVKGLVYLPSTRSLMKGAGWSLFFVLLALLLFAGQAFVTWSLFHSFGWLYVKDKLIGFLPLILLPMTVSLMVSFPRLWRLAMGHIRPSGEAPPLSTATTAANSWDLATAELTLPSNTPTEDAVIHEAATALEVQQEESTPEKTDVVDADWRREASAPELIVPLQATVLGVLIALVLQFLFPAVTLELPKLAIAWGVLIGGFSLLWIWQSWQQHRSSRPGEFTKLHPAIRFLRAAAILLALGTGIFYWGNQELVASILPDQLKMTDHTNIDTGRHVPQLQASADAHAEHLSEGAPGKLISVTELTGPRTGTPDRQFTLTAQKTTIQLPSGKTAEAWTFNGQYPGPELRIKQGELVEVVLENKDITDGVTIHWHGLHVPNAEDGVAGATQDAVMPGERHVYRFVAEQVGTYWYHSHQQASVQVRKGLLGALVIEPADSPQETGSFRDVTLIHHKLAKEGVTLNGRDTLALDTVSPGTSVRLRLINADNFPVTFQLLGTPFQVAAIDGNDVNEPNLIANQALLLAAGGRYDVSFTMPNRPVFFAQAKNANGKGLLLSPDGTGEVPDMGMDLPLFDPARYGSPQSLPFDLSTHFDREYQMLFDVQFGFYDGRLDGLWTINGKVFPDTPMMMVKEGDLVKMTFVNRSYMDHPMHLHGHHMLVLSRNGKAVTGSPWWTDTLNVAPGETYEVGFQADNPGLWMDHCHNQDHAALGMTMHLLYEGITSPFEMGRGTRNHPE
ncbi:multicopper oxidase domain-containing protein [Brevibacillus sp. NRS-1366]|uniref:multicopper oxidase domain-containing protein n=1 Tax=Brevibacillus sp. NRS-1366 TaxID=3233899 RepID=UPI003D259411